MKCERVRASTVGSRSWHRCYYSSCRSTRLGEVQLAIGMPDDARLPACERRGTGDVGWVSQRPHSRTAASDWALCGSAARPPAVSVWVGQEPRELAPRGQGSELQGTEPRPRAQQSVVGPERPLHKRAYLSISVRTERACDLPPALLIKSLTLTLTRTRTRTLTLVRTERACDLPPALLLVRAEGEAKVRVHLPG